MISIIILFAAGIAAALIRVQTIALRKRRLQLEMARALLAEHREALAEFVSDERASRYLKGVLLDLSESLEVGEVVERLAEIVRRKEKPGHSQSKLASEIDSLQRDYPDLAQVYTKAVATGMVAALLACDKTATQDDGLTFIFADPAQVQEVTRVVRDQARAGRTGPSFRPAHAA